MKKAICNLTMIALLLIGGMASAQIQVSIEQEMLDMSKGNKNAFTVVIENGNLKNVEKEMRKHFKDYKGKVSGSTKEEILFDDATIPGLSDNTIDLYVKMYETGSNVRVNTFWDLGGTFINGEEHPEKTELVNDRLRKFAVHFQRVLVSEELKDAEKELAARELSLQKMIKDNEKMHDKIGSSQRTIERTKKDISDNDVDQERKREEIAGQKEIVTKLVESPGKEKDLADKRLKELERNKKKLERENENMHQKISDLENVISETERGIEENLTDQNKQTEEIEVQRGAVNEVQERLGTIN